MKITVTPSANIGGSVVTLGDDAKGDVINGFLPEQNRVIQEVGYVRAKFKEFFPRFNKGNSVSFTVEKHHKNYDAALDFLCTHHDFVPEQGLVTVTQKSITRFYKDACFTEIKAISHTGETTIFAYTFLAGQCTVNTTP